MILSSLPESYNGLITALGSRPEVGLKLEFFKGKLIDEWRRRVENGAQQSSKQAMQTFTNEKKTCQRGSFS